MSRTNTNNKLFCKICFDAKKPEKEYTSHAIKTRDGEVCCPILKATECRYCHKMGHTLAHCELRNNKSVEQKPVTKPIEQKPIAKPVEKKPLSANKFAVFDESDSDSDDNESETKDTETKDTEPQVEHKFPTIRRKSTVCERPLNQVFHHVDLSYLAKERERLGQPDPALGKSYANITAKVAAVKDDFNRPDAPRGQDCFYTSEEEKQRHRAQLIAEHQERLKKPLFAAADEDW